MGKILGAKWFIVSGALLGLVAAFLVSAGNPGNMGVCAACFLRDSAGAFGFHKVETLQYLRPELLGLIFGGLIASVFWTKEFKAKTTNSAFSSFFLGVFAMIGALVFLGCPWRAFLRLGGGDMSALAGVFGLACGVGVGMFFKSRGFKSDEGVETAKSVAILPIIFAFGLVLALIFGFKNGAGAFFESEKGPGSMHASLILSLMGGIMIGIFMQKSKFCSVGAFANAFRGDFSMFLGVLAIIAAASAGNAYFGQYNFGFENQPIAHNDYIWNFLGMALAGLCFSLSGGCPGKHLVQIGTGNLGSMIFILGMVAGAAVAHNFLLASSPKGITDFAPYAVILGFIFALYLGIFARQKA